jgi:hypothetical protein
MCEGHKEYCHPCKHMQELLGYKDSTSIYFGVFEFIEYFICPCKPMSFMTTRKPYSLAISIKSAMSFLVTILLSFTIFSSNVGKLATLSRTPKTMTPPRLTDLTAVFMTLSDGAETIALSRRPPSSCSDSLRIALRFLGRE